MYESNKNSKLAVLSDFLNQRQGNIPPAVEVSREGHKMCLKSNNIVKASPSVRRKVCLTPNLKSKFQKNKKNKIKSRQKIKKNILEKLRAEAGAITGCVGRGGAYLPKNQYFAPFFGKIAHSRESVNFSSIFAVFVRFFSIFNQCNILICSTFEKIFG